MFYPPVHMVMLPTFWCWSLWCSAIKTHKITCRMMWTNNISHSNLLLQHGTVHMICSCVEK
jgi:hypothetical protein